MSGVAPNTVKNVRKSIVLLFVIPILLVFSGCAGSGRGVPIDDQRLKASQGDANAQLILAFAYDQGRGVAKDQAQAASWYRKAAEQGNAIAQNALGSLYQHGEGVSPDDAEAVRWYQKAVDLGYSEAYANLGYMYDKGLGVKQDQERAVELYRLGAEKGNQASMLHLGVSYWKGEGISTDLVQAIMWLDLARFYTQRSSNMQLRLRIRATRDEVASEATLEQIHKAGQLAQEWAEAHKRK